MAQRTLSTLIVSLALPAIAAAPGAVRAAEESASPVESPATEAETPAADVAPVVTQAEPTDAPDATAATVASQPEVTGAEEAPPEPSAVEEIRAAPTATPGQPAVKEPEQQGVQETSQLVAFGPWDGGTSPMRGSTLIYRNTTSAVSLVPSNDITYNPSYSMSLRASPQWWINDTINLWGDFYIGGQLTQSDTRTDGFYFLLDTEIGAAGEYTVPVVDIDVGLSLGVTFPTTRESQKATKVLGFDTELSLARAFDLSDFYVGTVAVEAAFGLGKDFHEYTTNGTSSVLTGACATELSTSCNIYSGARNVNFSFYGRMGVGAGPFDWLWISASAWLIQEQLYGAGDAGLGVSAITLEPTDAHYSVLWGLSATGTPVDLFSIRGGVRGYYEQLRPDGTYRTPFFNRTAQLYIDLILNAGPLYTLLGSLS